MALGSRFLQTAKIAVDRRLAAPEAHAAVAAIARTRLAELIAAGHGALARRIVDGVEGAPEEAVKLDHGQIIYVFSAIAQAAADALAFAVNRSPARSGRYKRAWFLSVDGRPWTAAIAAIPPGSTVTLTNAEPYHRKIDTGGERTSVPPLITEDTRRFVKGKYPRLDVQRLFVTIPGGYVLRGRASRHRRARRDRQRGQPLTYPAVVMSETV